MEKTEQQAEQAATKATREILKRIKRIQRTVLDFDKITKTEAEKILAEENEIALIIEKHIIDCYIASWITEAEELEDLFGLALPASFLLYLQSLKGRPDARLRKMAREYVKKIPVPKDRIKPANLATGIFRQHTPNDPIRYYVRRHFMKYIQQVSDIKEEAKAKDEEQELTKWRTGEHGESGLGFFLITLLRTESDTAQAEASLEVYIEADIPKYRFCSVLDDRTCTKCKELDGKVFLISERQPGVNYVPIHPRCRCWIEPVL